MAPIPAATFNPVLPSTLTGCSVICLLLPAQEHVGAYADAHRPEAVAPVTASQGAWRCCRARTPPHDVGFLGETDSTPNFLTDPV